VDVAVLKGANAPMVIRKKNSPTWPCPTWNEKTDLPPLLWQILYRTFPVVS
jgi:hypothetical protein